MPRLAQYSPPRWLLKLSILATGIPFKALVLSRGIALSMDGKGSWRDNVFIEGLWRSVKYEEIYLKAYEAVAHD